eukprot:3522648-Rhodomonas_salina.2
MEQVSARSARAESHPPGGHMADVSDGHGVAKALQDRQGCYQHIVEIVKQIVNIALCLAALVTVSMLVATLAGSAFQAPSPPADHPRAGGPVRGRCLELHSCAPHNRFRLTLQRSAGRKVARSKLCTSC